MIETILVLGVIFVSIKIAELIDKNRAHKPRIPNPAEYNDTPYYTGDPYPEGYLPGFSEPEDEHERRTR